ncbi:hypothetical protein FGB62_8g028 [Gracilaria domingensis]|nr:hypothetical protein FGB62_8g028 [Gracilaria domingensis]
MLLVGQQALRDAHVNKVGVMHHDLVNGLRLAHGELKLPPVGLHHVRHGVVQHVSNKVQHSVAERKRAHKRRCHFCERSLGPHVQVPAVLELALDVLEVEQVAKQELVLEHLRLGDDQAERPLQPVIPRKRLVARDGVAVVAVSRVVHVGNLRSEMVVRQNARDVVRKLIVAVDAGANADVKQRGQAAPRHHGARLGQLHVRNVQKVRPQGAQPLADAHRLRQVAHEVGGGPVARARDKGGDAAARVRREQVGRARGERLVRRGRQRRQPHVALAQHVEVLAGAQHGGGELGEEGGQHVAVDGEALLPAAGRRGAHVARVAADEELAVRYGRCVSHAGDCARGGGACLRACVVPPPIASARGGGKGGRGGEARAGGGRARARGCWIGQVQSGRRTHRRASRARLRIKGGAHNVHKVARGERGAQQPHDLKVRRQHAHGGERQQQHVEQQQHGAQHHVRAAAHARLEPVRQRAQNLRRHARLARRRCCRRRRRRRRRARRGRGRGRGLGRGRSARRRRRHGAACSPPPPPPPPRAARIAPTTKTSSSRARHVRRHVRALPARRRLTRVTRASRRSSPPRRADRERARARARRHGRGGAAGGVALSTAISTARHVRAGVRAVAARVGAPRRRAARAAVRAARRARARGGRGAAGGRRGAARAAVRGGDADWKRARHHAARGGRAERRRRGGGRGHAQRARAAAPAGAAPAPAAAVVPRAQLARAPARAAGAAAARARRRARVGRRHAVRVRPGRAGRARRRGRRAARRAAARRVRRRVRARRQRAAGAQLHVCGLSAARRRRQTQRAAARVRHPVHRRAVRGAASAAFHAASAGERPAARQGMLLGEGDDQEVRAVSAL